MTALRHSHALLVFAAAGLLLAACRDSKVTSYRVPKEKDPELPGASAGASNAGAAAPAMADAAVPTAAGPALTWTAPANWKVKAASAMRKGSYAVPGDDGRTADLSITAFPGDVGGELANVNRWRGRVQLPPLDEAGLPGAVASLAQNGLQFVVVDLAGGPASSPQRILGAIVPFADGTWFFKLTGPDALVARAKPDFLAFLKTVKPAAQP